MLELTVQMSPEGWDEVKEEFVEPKTTVLRLEHSLVALSKWESIWHKPFFSNQDKTIEETMSYIRCMTIDEEVDPEVYRHITKANEEEIFKYINDPMTATTFVEKKGKGGRGGVITTEIIYWWMTQLNIPVEFENWHINRLLTLVRVCNEKNNPGKKMSAKEIAARNAAINAANRKRFNSKG